MIFSKVFRRTRALGGLCVLVAVVGTYADPPQVVNLGYATYEGTFNSTANVTNFLGIRYAAPPVGKSTTVLVTHSVANSTGDFGREFR